jgi:NAD(P)-dependent dehydrogenase (short-subunit alcohol dehydrogenase family)
MAVEQQDQLCLPMMDAGALLKQRELTMAGKTVVITGGDSGIGFGMAEGLAFAGAKLIMLGYHLDKANAAAKNITQSTGNQDVHVLAPFDLSSFESVRATAKAVSKMAPSIDVLVCDAGVNQEGPRTTNVTEDGYEITFQTTFLGHFLLTEALVPNLRQAKGRVVNTACVTELFYNTSYSLYTPPNGTLCALLGLPENCTSLQYMKQSLTGPAQFSPFFGAPTSYGQAMLSKTMYSYEVIGA